MSQTASRRDFIAVESRLLVSLEVGWKKWRLAFGSEMGQRPGQRGVAAGGGGGPEVGVGGGKERFGFSQEWPRFSRYEGGGGGGLVGRPPFGGGGDEPGGGFFLHRGEAPGASGQDGSDRCGQAVVDVVAVLLRGTRPVERGPRADPRV